MCIFLSVVIIVIFLHYCIFFGTNSCASIWTNSGEAAGILEKALGRMVFRDCCPRDHSVGYPIGITMPITLLGFGKLGRVVGRLQIMWAKALL